MKTPLQIRRTRDGCRRSRRRRSPVFVKGWNLIAAMVMLSSLIGSIALTPASAVVAADPECDNGQVWDDSQQMCVDPTPDGGDQTMPTETPADMATETPEMTPTPMAGTISVYKYTCPQMYDFSAGGNPASDCTIPTDGVTMTLADASQQQQQQQTSGGVATFSEVMPGQFSLTETAPSNTAQAAWTCESPMQAPTSGSGSQIQGQIGEGEQLSCRFYNIPNGITIVVNKFMCPEGYDPSDQNANPSQDCAQPQNGVQFNVAGQTTGYTSQSNTGDSVNGAVTFGGLQPDTYTITETLPAGTSQAFVLQCVQVTLAGQQIPHYPTVTNGAIQYQFDNNDLSLICDWYNVPGTTGTPEMTPTPTMEMGTATPTLPSNGLTIIVHKFTCPAGYDVSGQNANPQLDCATMQDGVQFNTTGQTTGYAAQTNTGDSIPGAVMFGGLQPDTYTIVETPPMGTSSAFVTYCTLSTTNDPDVPIYPTVTNWSIQEQFDDTAIKFECYWYNVPSIDGSGEGTPTTMTPTMTPTMSGTPATPVSTEPSTLYIYKWLCPEGYNWGAPGANPQVDCATPMNGVQFNITGQTNGYTSQTNTGDSIPGAVMFGGIAPDTYHVVETLPATVESAFVTSCTVVSNEAPPILVALDGTPTVQGDLHPVVNITGATDIVVPGGVTITCQWYNVPKSGSSDLTIHKQNCDVETYVDDSSCTPNTTGVSFEVYRKDGANWVLKASAATDGTGTIALSGLNPGTYKLTELGGMWCDIKAIRQNGDGGTVSVLNPDGSFELVDGFETVVTVSNCTGGYGDITIYKWTCPPGYDYTKYGADPKTECTQATNGVQFNLAGQTKGYTSQTNTGDSINGAVYFGSIPTDTYTVTETVPADTWYVFVWDCTGSSVNQVNPMPLSTGNVLNIKVATNDKIVCNWYNVPNRTSGDLTIYKQWCSQPVYTSDVDCTIYEKGMTFTVNVKNGATWTPVSTQTTNNLGYIAISGLNPGTYQVVEQGGTPCKVVATQLDPNTNKYVSVINPDQSFPVTNGRETVVTVSNCTPKGKPAPPTKVPSKYPNTGVDPNATSHRSAQDTQVIEPGTPQTVEAPVTTTGTPESGEVVCPTLTAADNAAQSPIGTPIPDTTCARGQVPASISIPAIQVQATFEIKEIVGGELQEPTDENVVTWYKNTNRLGETGNVVVAGHLNYWGIPEAVFFKLNTLKQGDLITVTGADGGTYTYAVTSVQSVPITESPETWVGPTDKETITLMTCGGEWDSSISEYDSRTVVVAVRVPNPQAQQAGA